MKTSLLATLDDEEHDAIEPYLARQSFAQGDIVVTEGDATRAMYFVVEGEGRLRRGDLDIGGIGPGDHCGELGLIAGRPRAATLIASSPMTVLRLDDLAFKALIDHEPRAAIAFVKALVSSLGVRLTEMTDNVSQLLRERSLPRRVMVDVTIGGETRSIRTGTRVGEVLPADVAGARVVAALLDGKVVSLSTPLTASARVAPLDASHWEGQRVLRDSALLLLTEAAHVASAKIRIGPSMGTATWIDVREKIDVEGIRRAMADLVARDVPFQEEWWTVEEATTYFRDLGWNEAVDLLRTARDATVPLVTCGRVYTLRHSALLSRAGLLSKYELRDTDDGLLLLIGAPPPGLAAHAAWAEIMRDHQRWLAGLGIESVGAFNEACVHGNVSETIRVAEGFHEKRLGQIADAIAAREGVRVVCIAGPSSSGKTTFIKRLKVQLQVVGIDPVEISLDDYYVDREKTVRGPDGEYDYEALEALDLPLMRAQLGALLRDETVRMARYDFLTGRSLPSGGRTLHLGARSVLMVEGIHGLNPRILEDVPGDPYRIFIQPLAALPFDPVSRVSPSDLRLLRRIVRDRRGRGTTPGDNILRWRSVRRGERLHIFPFVDRADVVFDSSLVYELSVLRTYAERYLLEVPSDHPARPTAVRLRQLVDRFVPIQAAHVPATSILREFIGESSFEY